MDNPELERKLREMRLKKQQMLKDFTFKTIDTVNRSEEAALTHMSILDTNDPTTVKGKKLKKKAKPSDSAVVLGPADDDSEQPED